MRYKKKSSYGFFGCGLRVNGIRRRAHAQPQFNPYVRIRPTRIIYEELQEKIKRVEEDAQVIQDYVESLRACIKTAKTLWWLSSGLKFLAIARVSIDLFFAVIHFRLGDVEMSAYSGIGAFGWAIVILLTWDKPQDWRWEIRARESELRAVPLKFRIGQDGKPTGALV